MNSNDLPPILPPIFLRKDSPIFSSSSFYPSIAPPSFYPFIYNSNRPKFLIGVEFEGMVRNDIYNSFRASMCDLYLGKTGESFIQFGVDNSVKNVPEEYRAVEIRTKKISLRKGIKLFEEMLCFLYLASQLEDFITNETCGLHLNVSESFVFKYGKQTDFYYQILKIFDEKEILKTFGRENNIFCLPFFTENNPSREIEDIKCYYDLCKEREKTAIEKGEIDIRKTKESKYLSVSLRDSPAHRGYEGPQEINQRIEFRGIGNIDYHLKFDDLEKSLNYMLVVLRKAYREIVG